MGLLVEVNKNPWITPKNNKHLNLTLMSGELTGGHPPKVASHLPGLKFCAEQWPTALNDTPGQNGVPNGASTSFG